MSLELGDQLLDPGSQLFLATPLLSETKKSETPQTVPTWEEEGAGVEDVRSQTYSKERLESPHPAESRWGSSSELQPWILGPPQDDAPLDAQGRPGEGLRLEVRPSQEELGYIVTGNE